MKYAVTEAADKGRRVVILGCGAVGSRLARRWQAQGAEVLGVVRSAEGVARLAALGIPALRADLDTPAELAALPTAGALLYHFVQPGHHGEQDGRTRNLLQRLTEAPPMRLVYLGTSGVYGDTGGAWVDEHAPTPAPTPRARRRLDAELQLVAFAAVHAIPLARMRVGGIYGAGKLPRARLERGEPILCEAQAGYTNRIHLEDLVTIAFTLGQRGTGVFNVSDGRPGNMSAYFKAVADTLGLPRPTEIDLAEARERLTPAMLEYLGESRRLRAERIRTELGIELSYPDLASGLAQATARQEGAP